MNSIIFKFLLIFIIVAACHARAFSATRVTPDATIKLEKVFNNNNISVFIATHSIDIGKPSDGRPNRLSSSCTYSRYPCVLVDGIDVHINNRLIFIPRSAYYDLSDIYSAEITYRNGLYALILSGGDASESYEVEIILNNSAVKSRIMRSMPSKSVMQITKYHTN